MKKKKSLNQRKKMMKKKMRKRKKTNTNQKMMMTLPKGNQQDNKNGANQLGRGHLRLTYLHDLFSFL